MNQHSEIDTIQFYDDRADEGIGILKAIFEQSEEYR